MKRRGSRRDFHVFGMKSWGTQLWSKERAKSLWAHISLAAGLKEKGISESK